MRQPIISSSPHRLRGRRLLAVTLLAGLTLSFSSCQREEFPSPQPAGATAKQAVLHKILDLGFKPEHMQDHALLRRTVCNFTLEWTHGSKVRSHPASAHWTAAVLIESLLLGS